MSPRLQFVARWTAVLLLAAGAAWATRPGARQSSIRRPAVRTVSPAIAQKKNAASILPAPESRAAVDAIRAAGGTVTMTNDGQVRAVNLTGSAIGDDDLKHLAAMPRITLLNLDGTRITDEGLRHIRDLPELSILRLCRTPISDAGLANLDRLPQLSTLILDDTAITDAGMTHLLRLPKLRSITVMGCPVTDQAQKIIHERLPECRVKR